jgi:predicted ester cyclase
MSLDTNKAVVKQVLEGFNARNWDEVRKLYSPQYVNHNPPPDLTADLDGQLEAMKGLVASFPDAEVEATHVVAEGELIVVRDVLRGKHDGEFAGTAATGNDVSIEFIHVYRIVDGQIHERWGLLDALGLMQQIGALGA